MKGMEKCVRGGVRRCIRGSVCRVWEEVWDGGKCVKVCLGCGECVGVGPTPKPSPYRVAYFLQMGRGVGSVLGWGCRERCGGAEKCGERCERVCWGVGK